MPEGQLVQLENPNGQDAAIYFTLDGSDPRLPGGDISPVAQVFAGGGLPVTVILSSSSGVPGSVWHYLDTGVDLSGDSWKSPDFDDSTSSFGASQLGYGDRDEHTVVSYGESVGNKHITRMAQG